jgi:hypothetical protein
MPAIVADLPPSSPTLAPSDHLPGLGTVGLVDASAAKCSRRLSCVAKGFGPTDYVCFLDWPFVRLNAAVIPVAEVTLLVESC